MTRKSNAVLLGRIDCYCGERAAVYQNTRQYLYTRCPSCRCDPPVKCNQDNSAAYQVHVWRQMDPLPGAVIHRPRNVPAGEGEPGAKRAGVAVIEPADREPAPAAIGAGGAPEPAPAPTAPAGAAPAPEPEKAEEILQVAGAGQAPAAAPAGEPDPAGKKPASALLFWGVLTTLSLAAAGVAAVLSGNKPEGAAP